MIFLSYSRQQLYFAESLALHLQHQGHPIWFDLQQLAPGSEWQAALNTGLAECEQLVLVVSKAALASPYVQAEWQAALDAGKPVVLAIFEATPLPDALRALPAYDFRRRFKEPMLALAHRLAHPEAAPTPPPAPKPSPVKVRLTLPTHILLLLVVMASTAISGIAGGAWLLVNTDGNSLALLALAFMGWLGYSTVQFARRQADYRAVRLVMSTALAGSWGLLLVGLVVSLLLQNDAPEVGVALAGIAVGCTLLVTYLYGYVLNFAPSLLRWFAAGKVNQGLRQRVNRGLARRVLKLGVTYRLHVDPADQPTAHAIRRIFRAYPLLRETDDEADFHLILVSNHTSVEQLAAWAAEYEERMMVIIIAPIQLPDSLRVIMKYQWVDFIGRDVEQMQQLAENMQNPERARVGYALSTVPQRVERFRTPARVTFWLLYLRNTAAVTLAAGALALFRPFDGERVAVGGALLMVVLGALGFGLAHAVISRRVPLWGAVIGFLVVTLGFSVVNPLSERAKTYTVQRGDTLQSIAADQCGASYFWRTVADENDLNASAFLRVGTKLRINCGPLGVLNEVVMPAIMTLLLLGVALFPLWRWLPSRVVVRRAVPTVQVTGGQWRTVAVSVVWVVVALLVLWPTFG